MAERTSEVFSNASLLSTSPILPNPSTTSGILMEDIQHVLSELDALPLPPDDEPGEEGDSQKFQEPDSVISHPPRPSKLSLHSIPSFPLEENFISPTAGLAVINSSVMEPPTPAVLLEGTKVTNLKGVVTYTWFNLSVNVPLHHGFCKRREDATHHRILNDSIGCIKSGEVWAVAGCRHAGKSTLIKTLSFSTSKSMEVEGDRCVNASPIGVEVMSAISAFVEKEDLFLPRLTVSEHLNFCAQLRLPSQFMGISRGQRVDEILQEFDLWMCRHKAIGCSHTAHGISAAEKKRLAFAVGNLTDPNIIFAHDALSGLESTEAISLIQLMNSLASRGKVIMLTIEQPPSEVFCMLNNLYLMAEGRVIYSGPRDDAMPFFASLGFHCPAMHNPIDHYLRLLRINPDFPEVCEDRVNSIADSFEQTKQYDAYLRKAGQRKEKTIEILLLEEQYSKYVYAASICRQLRSLMLRHFLLTLRDPCVCGIKFVQHIIIGLLLGLIMYKTSYDVEGAASISGGLFIATIVQVILPIYALVKSFSCEIPVFTREHSKHLYRSSTYFISRSLVEAPIYWVFPWMFMPQLWYIAGLAEPYPIIASACLTLSLLATAAVSIGYMFSSWSPSLKFTLSALPSVFVGVILFSGFFMDDKGVSFNWILKYVKYASPFYLAWGNLMQFQWEFVPGINHTLAFIPPIFSKGLDVLQYFNVQPQNYCHLLGLTTLIFIPRILGYLGLVWTKSKE